MKNKKHNDDYLTLANKRYNDSIQECERKAQQERERITLEYAKIEQKEKAEKRKHTRAIISTITAIISFMAIILTIILITR